MTRFLAVAVWFVAAFVSMSVGLWWADGRDGETLDSMDKIIVGGLFLVLWPFVDAVALILAACWSFGHLGASIVARRR